MYKEVFRKTFEKGEYTQYLDLESDYPGTHELVIYMNGKEIKRAEYRLWKRGGSMIEGRIIMGVGGLYDVAGTTARSTACARA